MNKKIIVIILIVILVIVVLLSDLTGNYKVEVSTVDNFSPDRILEIYKNNKRIEFEKIQYEDGTVLCYSENPVVAYTELVEVKELVIVLNNNKKVMAKIVEK